MKCFATHNRSFMRFVENYMMSSDARMQVPKLLDETKKTWESDIQTELRPTSSGDLQAFVQHRVGTRMRQRLSSAALKPSAG